jgi:hypothetical protein
MCKYMYIHAYIKTRTLETMRQRRPKNIKTISNQNFNLEKENTYTWPRPQCFSTQSPDQCGAQTQKKPGVPCNHQLFSRAGLPWRGAGAVASSMQTPPWPSCADRRVVSGRHRGLVGHSHQKPNTRHTSHAHLSWGKSWT